MIDNNMVVVILELADCWGIMNDEQLVLDSADRPHLLAPPSLWPCIKDVVFAITRDGANWHFIKVLFLKYPKKGVCETTSVSTIENKSFCLAGPLANPPVFSIKWVGATIGQPVGKVIGMTGVQFAVVILLPEK